MERILAYAASEQTTHGCLRFINTHILLVMQASMVQRGQWAGRAISHNGGPGHVSRLADDRDRFGGRRSRCRSSHHAPAEGLPAPSDPRWPGGRWRGPPSVAAALAKNP